ncbi:MAG TPA: glycosyltransferase family 2 protein [Polyangiaceae bacterium]|nr:glycosyltransferase family 2 protein [Polyangiaceae bacterium]
MKLIIQIPCFNERDQLPRAFADLPRHIDGVDEIEVLIIDDGSSDGTQDVARDLGVHHILRLPQNRGLAVAYTRGLDACARLGADLVVNTDADSQYRGDDIARLVQPILSKSADIVVGDRQTDTIDEFSPLKKVLQRWGSSVVRTASGTTVQDSTSGFRALNRRALNTLFVHNRFTYTLETLIQAGHLGLALADIKITTNPKTRPSRLFKSIPSYLARNGLVILRAYAMYSPVRTFGSVALSLFLVGAVLVGRFLYFFLADPSYSGHLQSLLVGVASVILAFVVGLFAVQSELIAANRRLLEELLVRARRQDARSSQGLVDGLESTAAPSWTRS